VQQVGPTVTTGCRAAALSTTTWSYISAPTTATTTATTTTTTALQKRMEKTKSEVFYNFVLKLFRFRSEYLQIRFDYFLSPFNVLLKINFTAGQPSKNILL